MKLRQVYGVSMQANHNLTDRQRKFKGLNGLLMLHHHIVCLTLSIHMIYGINSPLGYAQTLFSNEDGHKKWTGSISGGYEWVTFRVKTLSAIQMPLFRIIL